MTTWNDIDINLAKHFLQNPFFRRDNPAQVVLFFEDLFNNLELLKQKEIKVCRILQKP